MSRATRSILAAFRRLLPGRTPRPLRHPKRGDMPFSESEIRLVALVLGEWDRALLSRIAAERRWAIHFARTCDEAWEALNERKAQIILCQREMADMDWRPVIRKMASAPHLVCAILVSNVTDAYLWNEVVSRGGHDVLATPLREENVLRAVRLAWLYWNSARKYNAGAA